MSHNDISLWCDVIERAFIEQELPTYIAQRHVLGATSNPSIFAHAITHSHAYAPQIKALANHPHITPKALYEALALEDIRRAAKVLKPLYEANRNNGYISIEIDPMLCDDVKGSIDEGKRLYEQVGYENVMIKVPATPAGYEIMKTLFYDGIPINATLVFSASQAKTCAAILAKNAQPHTRAVISIFVSRFDVATNIASHTSPHKALSTPPRLGILNAMLCYNAVQDIAHPHIRPLFASISTKQAELDKDYYIKHLIAPHSVNTAPLDTICAFIDALNMDSNASLHGSYTNKGICPANTPTSSNEITSSSASISSNTITSSSAYASSIDAPHYPLAPWHSTQEALQEIAQILPLSALEALQEQLLLQGLEAFKQSFSTLLAHLATHISASRP